MRTRRIYTFFIFMLLASISSYAQGRWLTARERVERDPEHNVMYEGVYRYTPPLFRHCNISMKEQIDVSRLRIAYDVLVVCDTLTGIRYMDRMITQIGETYYCSFGESLWKNNMLYTIGESHPDANLYNIEDNYEEIINISVYRNIRTGQIINGGQPPEPRAIFTYVEHKPSFRWKLTGECKEIEGYTCQKAIAEHAGREWTVWFTPEIPADGGLWKFNGLPGLVIEAEDSRGHYRFTMTEISKVEEPIYLYRTTPGKRLTREQYRKTEQSIYDDPIKHSYDGQDHFAIRNSNRGLSKEIFTSGHFLYPYNPIELK